jgi:hypothetical protein
MIQIILKFTFLSQIFPDQQHGNLVIHQLFSTQYLFQLSISFNSITQQLNNSATLLTLSTLHSCLSICCKAKAYAPSEMARLAPSFEMVIPMRFIGS